MDGMEFDVKKLTMKMCHNVEEIRVRALNSLLYKVEHKLISTPSLVHETELHKALLKCFKYSTGGHAQAISLLNTLACEDTVCVSLTQLGALGVLEEYTEKGGACREGVEALMSKLLTLPTQEETTQLSGYSTQTLEAEESEQKLSSISEPFLNATQVLDQPIFDTVPLDHNDICILENIEARLVDEVLCEASCEFVMSVLLQDFPPEVFLQRSGVLTNIISLLSEEGRCGGENLAVQCLIRFISRIEQRFSLLSQGWLSAPSWVKEGVPDGAGGAGGRGGGGDSGVMLTLPHFVFSTLRAVLPLYRRCDNEETSSCLSTLLLSLSSLLDTINTAPVKFNVNMSQLTSVFGLLGESIRILHRRWLKTDLTSSLPLTLLSTLISFSLSFFSQFLPSTSLEEHLPTGLLDTLRDVYCSQVFSIAHSATHTAIEVLLQTVDPCIVEQKVRVCAMLDVFYLSLHHDHLNSRQIEQIYDGMECAVHFNPITEHMVRALVHNLPSHKETCSAALVWLLGTRSVQRVAYSTLRELALDGMLNVTQEVVWEMVVHGLTAATELQLLAADTLKALINAAPSLSPSCQLVLFKHLQPSLFFLTTALTHCAELRETVIKYLKDSAPLMTEVQSIKAWCAMLFSRELTVREQGVLSVVQWCSLQGVDVSLAQSSMLVAESGKVVLTLGISCGTIDQESLEKLRTIAFNTALTTEIRASALEQLHVVLSDASLHQSLGTLSNNLLSILMDISPNSSLTLPAVKCLRHIVHYNTTLRETHSADPEVYVTLLRLVGLRDQPPDKDLTSEVGTILILLVTQSFSSPSHWSKSSYYALHQLVLPDHVPVALHLPAHITVVAPARPLPPSTLPGNWLSWLQLHYNIVCAGGLDLFIRSSEQFTLPEVGHAHTVLKLCYLHSQLADLSTEYLVTVTTLSILTEDNRLSKHVQQELQRRASLPHPGADLFTLLKYYQSHISTALLGRLISILEETLEGPENKEQSLRVLEFYCLHRLTQNVGSAKLYPVLYKLHMSLHQRSGQELALSQLTSQALAISAQSACSDSTAVVELVKLIDSLSQGRGSPLSYMGACVLRNSFSTLASVSGNMVKLRWLLPWFTDKDPAIRSAAFSMSTHPSASPLTIESSVVLALSAFSDPTEVFLVRQHALYFVARIIRSLLSGSDPEQEQAFALVMLAVKRAGFYDSCVRYVTEMRGVVEHQGYNNQTLDVTMISTYFEECSTDMKYSPGYDSLFSMLGGVLEVCLALSNVTMYKDVTLLLKPLYSLITMDLLKAIVLFNGDPSLDMYCECFSKVLELILLNGANQFYFDSAKDCTLFQTVCNLVCYSCEKKSVIKLKEFCLHFIEKITPQGSSVFDEQWSVLVPFLITFLTNPQLQHNTLRILLVHLQESKKKPSCLEVYLSNNKSMTDTMSKNLFSLLCTAKVTNARDEEYNCVLFTVIGLCCKQAARQEMLQLGLAEVMFEYIVLLEKHLNNLLLLAGDKENSVPNVRGRKKGGPKKQAEPNESDVLLKCVTYCLYCLTACIHNEPQVTPQDTPQANPQATAQRIADLDIIPLISRLWSFFSTNIMVLNSVVEFLSTFVVANSAVSKKLLQPGNNKKCLLSQVLEVAEKSVLFTNHPISPLRPLFFNFLSNICQYKDCTMFIWKSGFMSNFPSAEKCDKRDVLSLWLHLIAHMSYTTFGQLAILNIPNIMNTMFQSSSPLLVLTILRSLASNVKCHPKLLANKQFIDFVLKSVSLEKVKETQVCLQVLELCVSVSSKTRVEFRNKGAGQVLGSLQLKLQDNPQLGLNELLGDVLRLYEG